MNSVTSLTSHSSLNPQNSQQFDNLRVFVRVRPPLNRETIPGLPFRSVAIVDEDQKSISLAEYLGAEPEEAERQREWLENPQLFRLHRFTFDRIFDLDASQVDVYNAGAQTAVASVLEGYNSTVFAYGQSGAGKTYTMEGFTYDKGDPNRGIIQRTIEDIFTYIETTSNENTKFIIRASFLQIYNESISDLLKPEKKNLQIREDKKKGIYVDMLSEWAVRSPADLYALLKRGENYRTTASTYLNDVSSRSHAVFVITVEQMTTEIINNQTHTQIKVGKLNLVDLAGSERIRITVEAGVQLEESKKINKSLSCLGNVINALTDKKGRIHIPYRDSKLTRLLQDSLGGNCKTTMIAMISPSQDAFSESLSTLYFAQRAKKIRNRPIINEDLNNRALIRQYETELKNLRAELEQKSRQLESNELVMQLQEEKEQLLQDKESAIRELEKASRQYLVEREEKLRLEKKIAVMNSQLLVGGHRVEETPQFRSALQSRIKAFESRLMEIEKERDKKIEEDRAENEEHKELLGMQRDIMARLTEKLRERDEAIEAMQEEIGEMEEIEEINNHLKSRISLLESLLTKNSIPFPSDKYQTSNDNNINNNKNKNNAKSSNFYLPFEVESDPNSSKKGSNPNILLSPEEKIKELRILLEEKENKIIFLSKVNQRFVEACGNEGEIRIEKLLNQMEKNQELYDSIENLQKENHELNNEIKKLKILSDKDNVAELKNYISFNIDSIIKKCNDENTKNTLINLKNNIDNMNDNENMKNKQNNIIAIPTNYMNERGDFSTLKKSDNIINKNVILEKQKLTEQINDGNIQYSGEKNGSNRGYQLNSGKNMIKGISFISYKNQNENINNINSSPMEDHSMNNERNKENLNKKDARLRNKNYINKFINSNQCN